MHSTLREKTMPNTLIQAAAEGMPDATRRRFLQLLPATAALAAVPAPAQSAPIDPMEAAHYHATQLAEAMGRANPEMTYRFKIDEKKGYAFVIGDSKEDIERAARPIYDGPNFYEIDPGNGTRPILWLERVEYRTTPGHYYIAERRWKGRLEAKPRRLKEKQFRFVSKVENYGGRA
jgi:hypothetical protein